MNRFGTLEVYYNSARLEGQEASGRGTPGLATRSLKMLCSNSILPGWKDFRQTILKRGQQTGC